MNYLDLLPLTSFLFCAGLALLIIIRRRWQPIALAFCLGMASIAVVEFTNFMVLKAPAEDLIIRWKRFALIGETLLAANWCLFSLLFGKKDIGRTLKKWKWMLLSVYVVPAIFLGYLFVANQEMVVVSSQVIKLGQAVKYFQIPLLLVIIITLMHLENTFRSSAGVEKWKIKYLIFGLGSILVIYVYILTQRILYSRMDLTNIYLFSAIVIIANFLIIYSVMRNKIVDGDIYVSRRIVYTSFSLVGIGLYSIFIGVGAQIINSFDIQSQLKLEIIFVFITILVIITLFYSESLRRRAKSFINRNFKKSKYVYRDEWMVFSSELSTKVNTKEVCEALLKNLYERLLVKHMSLWLANDNQTSFSMICSLNLHKLDFDIGSNNNIIEYLYNNKEPLSKSQIMSNEDLLPLSKEISNLFDKTRAELVVPMTLADTWVGLLTLGKIQTGEGYDEIEDYNLLKSIAAHAASAINSARLFEEQIRARELEAFHRLSSFVMHDMKNATTMLSMLAQNAEKHLCNPEFQKDALQTISEAVGRMKKMIESLSTLPDQLKLELKKCDLNELINDTVNELGVNGLTKINIERHLGELSPVEADAEEIQKVVHNLVLNACEAMDSEGQVRVSSRANEDYVVFRVSDNGRGMSKEFLEKSLFKPFKSTKKKGLGIGLYQCKTIVEAHGGRIEVESEEGVGTTFSVYLPIQKPRGMSQPAEKAN